MSIVLPRQLGYDSSWQESAAMREWMRKVTAYMNAPPFNFRGSSIRYAVATSNGTSPSQVGMVWSAGTSAGAAPSAGTFYGSLSRVIIETPSAAPSESVSTVDAVARYCTGSATAAGGYRIELVFGPGCGATWGAGGVMFAGLAAATPTLGTTSISSLTDVIGIEVTHVTGACNLIHNDASGAPTSISLGTAYPTAGNPVYCLTLDMPRNGTTLTYRVDRLDNTQTTAGTITSNLPAANTMLKLVVAVGTPSFTNNYGGAFFRAMSEQPN